MLPDGPLGVHPSQEVGVVPAPSIMAMKLGWDLIGAGICVERVFGCDGHALKRVANKGSNQMCSATPASVAVTTPVAGRLIFIHLRCWEVLPFLTIQRQRCTIGAITITVSHLMSGN